MFCGTAGNPQEQTNYSIYSVFRGIIFLSEIANPTSVFISIPIQWNLQGVPAADQALLK
jgi:hypothetical protein